eukprot:4257792-Karenia_brevis.AAC.1
MKEHPTQGTPEKEVEDDAIRQILELQEEQEEEEPAEEEQDQEESEEEARENLRKRLDFGEVDFESEESEEEAGAQAKSEDERLQGMENERCYETPSKESQHSLETVDTVDTFEFEMHGGAAGEEATRKKRDQKLFKGLRRLLNE